MIRRKAASYISRERLDSNHFHVEKKSFGGRMFPTMTYNISDDPSHDAVSVASVIEKLKLKLRGRR